MINVAIIDDDEQSIVKMNNKILLVEQWQQYSFTIDTYTVPTDVEEKILEYDIYFLDIDMPQIDGISLAHKIRQLNSSAIIIFMTNKEDLVHDSLLVQPLYFIRKAHFEVDCDVLSSLLVRKLETSQNWISLSIDRSEQRLYIKDIVYIGSFDHYVVIHITNNQYKLKRSISKLLLVLKQHNIIRIHKSYLVNMMYISHIKKQTIFLKNNMQLPIGRKYKDDVSLQYKRYLILC